MNPNRATLCSTRPCCANSSGSADDRRRRRPSRGGGMSELVSPRRRREVLDALRRGTVPANGLDQLAVGLTKFDREPDAELTTVAGGGAVFKAVRGEYGAG